MSTAPKKPGHLLLQAFKAMKEPNGLTASQIIKFYSKTHDVPMSRASLAVKRALRMGLATGFVDKKRNRFLLGTEDGDVAALLPVSAERITDPSSQYMAGCKKRRRTCRKTKDQLQRLARRRYRERVWVRHRAGYKHKPKCPRRCEELDSRSRSYSHGEDAPDSP